MSLYYMYLLLVFRYEVHIYVFTYSLQCTDTFLCIHTQLEWVKSEGLVNFFQFVKSSRIRRPSLVSELVIDNPHNALCHELIIKAVICIQILSVCASPCDSGPPYWSHSTGVWWYNTHAWATCL